MAYGQARREELAREAGFSSYRAAREARAAAADQERGGPRASRIRQGVDVSGAGTSADGPPMRKGTLGGLVARAAAVMGRDTPVTLKLLPTEVTTSGGGYGLLDDDTGEIEVSLEGSRDRDTGQWEADEPTLGDLLDAIEDNGGDVDDGLTALLLGTVGVEDADGIESFHLTIPGYYGG